MKAFRKEEISLPPLSLSNDKKNYLGSGTLKNADRKEFIDRWLNGPTRIRTTDYEAMVLTAQRSRT